MTTITMLRRIKVRVKVVIATGEGCAAAAVSEPVDLRSADRDWIDRDFGDNSSGFRLARTL